MADHKDIHSILEVLNLVEAMGTTVHDALADGKITWTDLPKLSGLWAPAKLALEDLHNVSAEAADLDATEVQQLIAKAVEMVQAWIGVFGAPAKVVATTPA